MQNLHQLEIASPTLQFSCGHFTIFSETKRENLHGHDYQLSAILSSEKTTAGLSFDYRDYIKRLKSLCKLIDTRIVLPERNPHLQIETADDQVIAYYNGETLQFLPRDVVLLSITNSTLEELSGWFLKSLLNEYQAQLNKDNITAITMKLSTRPGQTGYSFWQKTS